MIEWIPYNSKSRDIESHKNHLVTNGEGVWIMQHAKIVNSLSETGYCWHEGRLPSRYSVITHWAKINLPQAFKATESPSAAEAVAGLKEVTP